MQVVHFLLVEQTEQFGGLKLCLVGQHQFLDHQLLPYFRKVGNNLKEDILKNAGELILQHEYLQHLE